MTDTPVENAAPEASENAKRRQILEGARQSFLDLGFDGTSMNDIARVAGVSKGTLYVYFPSKEALFEAFIREEKHEQAEQICAPGELSEDIETALTRYGREFVHVLTRPESLAHMRTVLGISVRIPSIGQTFYDAGPRHGTQMLAQRIEQHVASGELALEDAREAATTFIALLKSELFSQALFLNQIPTKEQIARHCAQSVRLFMRLYGAKRA